MKGGVFLVLLCWSYCYKVTRYKEPWMVGSTLEIWRLKSTERRLFIRIRELIDGNLLSNCIYYKISTHMDGSRSSDIGHWINEERIVNGKLSMQRLNDDSETMVVEIENRGWENRFVRAPFMFFPLFLYFETYYYYYYNFKSSKSTGSWEYYKKGGIELNGWISNYKITFNEKIYVSILVSLSLRIDSFPIFSKKKNIKNLENEKRERRFPKLRMKRRIRELAVKPRRKRLERRRSL